MRQLNHVLTASLLCCLIMAQSLGAQILTGTVTESATRTALSGVVILVTDSTGRVIARGRSGIDGRYHIDVGRQGRFAVKSLRLGFRPSIVPVRLARQSEELRLDLSVSGVPALLQAVVSRATARCEHIAADSAVPAYQILDQIRAALYATELTAHPRVSRAFNVTITELQRTLNPSSGTVSRESAWVRSGVTVAPWSSLRPDAIHDSGYTRTEGAGGTLYFAPDIAVLVSAEFVDDHCFRIARGSSAAEIRLEFEPVRSRRRIPEIRGAMLVDAKTSELRRVDFEYVNVPRAIQDADAGGTLLFIHAKADTWFISGWRLRLPIFEERETYAGHFGESRRSERRSVLAGLRETGGELGLVARGTDTLYAAEPLLVRGRVVDSSGRGVPDARVRVRGTGLAAMTARDGSFEIAGILPGYYNFEASTPMYEPWHVPTKAKSITRLDTSLVIALPTAESLMRADCGPAPGGAVAGRVFRRDSTPVLEGTVVISWGTADSRMTRDTTVDARGFFRFCGVPFESRAVVQVMRAGLTDGAREVAVSAGLPIAIADIVVDTTTVSRAILGGRVLDAVSGAPIANASVRLKGTGISTVTDANGRYRLSSPMTGTDTLSVRRIGFRAEDLEVRLRSSGSSGKDVVLARVVELDTVTVRTSALPSSFYEHQRIGLGQFLTREQLERSAHRRLSEVLEGSMRGISLIRSSGNQTALGAPRGQHSLDSRCYELEGTPVVKCGCFPAIYLDNLVIFDGRTGSFIPDINRFAVGSIEAIEFYSGPSQTPATYSNLDTSCGVLVIHTRR